MSKIDIKKLERNAKINVVSVVSRIADYINNDLADVIESSEVRRIVADHPGISDILRDVKKTQTSNGKEDQWQIEDSELRKEVEEYVFEEVVSQLKGNGVDIIEKKAEFDEKQVKDEALESEKYFQSMNIVPTPSEIVNDVCDAIEEARDHYLNSEERAEIWEILYPGQEIESSMKRKAEDGGLHWTEVGLRELENAERVDRFNEPGINKEDVESAIRNMEWREIKKGETVPMGPGEGIKSTIKEFKIPATHYAISNDLAPYGFYGIRGKYKNGIHNIFVLDSGVAITPICVESVSDEGKVEDKDNSIEEVKEEVNAVESSIKIKADEIDEVIDIDKIQEKGDELGIKVSVVVDDDGDEFLVFQKDSGEYFDIRKEDILESESMEYVINTYIKDFDKYWEQNVGQHIESSFNKKVIIRKADVVDKKSKGKYKFDLSAVPNPDFDKDSHEGTVKIPKETHYADSLEEVRSIFEKFRDDNNLGSGNVPYCKIYDTATNQPVARISYNGRIWNSTGGDWKEGDEALLDNRANLNLKKSEKEKPRVKSPIKYDMLLKDYQKEMDKTPEQVLKEQKKEEKLNIKAELSDADKKYFEELLSIYLPTKSEKQAVDDAIVGTIMHADKHPTTDEGYAMSKELVEYYAKMIAEKKKISIANLKSASLTSKIREVKKQLDEATKPDDIIKFVQALNMLEDHKEKTEKRKKDKSKKNIEIDNDDENSEIENGEDDGVEKKAYKSGDKVILQSLPGEENEEVELIELIDKVDKVWTAKFSKDEVGEIYENIIWKKADAKPTAPPTPGYKWVVKKNVDGTSMWVQVPIATTTSTEAVETISSSLNKKSELEFTEENIISEMSKELKVKPNKIEISINDNIATINVGDREY